MCQLPSIKFRLHVFCHIKTTFKVHLTSVFSQKIYHLYFYLINYDRYQFNDMIIHYTIFNGFTINTISTIYVLCKL